MKRIDLLKTLFFLLPALVLSGACGNEPEQEEPLPFEEDGPDSDGDEDGGDHADGDGVADGGDGDGPVDGVGDNCPAISNPDQRDRDRDEVGDACDWLPYFYDPSNPQGDDVPILREETGPPNGTFQEARDGWQIQVPFRLEGALSAPGEIDHYAIEIDGPTTLLVHMEPLGGSIWPGLIFVGDEPSNEGYQAVVLADNSGEEVVQDVHLPYRGRYIVAVSDFRTLTSQGQSGGANFGYRLSLSSPPLPEPEVISLPAPRVVTTYDREIYRFQLEVTGRDALRVIATGASRNQNSILLPGIQIFDTHDHRLLAHTIQEQIPEGTTRNELNLKLGDEVETVDILVFSHLGLGVNDLLIEMEFRDQLQDLERIDDPRDSRGDHLLWVTPGAELRGAIDPPRLISDTQLRADRDYFLVAGQRGDFLEIEVAPAPGSLVIPEIEVGTYFFSPSFEFFSSWHRSRLATERGQTSRLSALVTGRYDGELAISIVHRGNATVAPVGGPQYGYELSVRRAAIPAADQGLTFPARIPVALASGEQGVFAISLQGGSFYQIDFPGNFSRQLQLVDPDTFEVLEESQSSIRYMPPESRDYLLLVRDSFGSAIPASAGLEIRVEALQIDAPQVAVPLRTTGELTSSGEWFRVQLAAEDHHLIHLLSSTGEELRYDLFDSLTMETLLENRTGLTLFETMNRGEVLLRIVGPQSGVDYGLFVGPFSPSIYDDQVDALIEGGVEPVIYSLPDQSSGLLFVEVESPAFLEIEAQIWNADRERVSGLGSSSRVGAAGQDGERYIALIPKGFEVQSYTFSFSIDQYSAEEAQALADTEATRDNPHLHSGVLGIYRGTLSPTLSRRRIELDLNAGDVLDLFAMAAPGTNPNDLDPDLELYDPNGVRVDWDWSSGEGNFPILPDTEINQTGRWAVELNLWNSNSSGTGEFLLYLLVHE